MIKEVLNNMKKVIKKVVEPIVVENKDCSCTNLLQTSDGVVCKDCGRII